MIFILYLTKLYSTCFSLNDEIHYIGYKTPILISLHNKIKAEYLSFVKANFTVNIHQIKIEINNVAKNYKKKKLFLSGLSSIFHKVFTNNVLNLPLSNLNSLKCELERNFIEFCRDLVKRKGLNTGTKLVDYIYEKIVNMIESEFSVLDTKRLKNYEVRNFVETVSKRLIKIKIKENYIIKRIIETDKNMLEESIKYSLMSDYNYINDNEINIFIDNLIAKKKEIDQKIIIYLDLNISIIFLDFLSNYIAKTSDYSENDILFAIDKLYHILKNKLNKLRSRKYSNCLFLYCNFPNANLFINFVYYLDGFVFIKIKIWEPVYNKIMSVIEELENVRNDVYQYLICKGLMIKCDLCMEESYFI